LFDVDVDAAATVNASGPRGGMTSPILCSQSIFVVFTTQAQAHTKTMTRSKTVLNDTTTNNNNKKTAKKTNSTSTKMLKKLDEKQWRRHILAFYKSDLPQSTYIEKNKIKSYPLRTRFDKSGLKSLKKCNTPYSDAVIQYDFWFKQWNSSLCDKQAVNRTNIRAGFIFHVDDEEVGEDARTTASSTGTPSTTSTATTNINENDDFLDRPSIEEVEVGVEKKKQ
jgi:hypothetical protein